MTSPWLLRLMAIATLVTGTWAVFAVTYMLSADDFALRHPTFFGPVYYVMTFLNIATFVIYVFVLVRDPSIERRRGFWIGAVVIGAHLGQLAYLLSASGRRQLVGATETNSITA